MALLAYADMRNAQPQDGTTTTMRSPFFTDPARREARREMILRKRGMHGR